MSDVYSVVAVDYNDASLGPDGDGTEVGWRIECEETGMLMDRFYFTSAEATSALFELSDT